MDPSFTTSMSPMERHSFKQVAEWCQSDVQRLCGNNASPDFVPMPPMLDVGSVLEDMMMRAFQEQAPRDLGMAPPHEQDDESGGPVIFFRAFSSGCSEDLFVNHVLLHVVPLIATTSLAPEDVASSITEKAQVLSERFEGEGDNVRGRMARRLSEVTPQDIEQHRRRVLFLPFSDQQNECLTRYQNQVSIECGSAIQGLLQTRAVQLQNVMQKRMEILDVYANFCLLYALLTFTAAVLYFRRRRSMAVPPAQIFRAIYSRPNIKKEVENEVGSSIGNIPPFMALRGVMRMRKLTLFAVVLMAVLVLFDLISGADALVVCIFFATVLCLRTLLWSPTDDAVECSCCCCGATPQDSATLTEAQACCKCCQGTGVCSVNCDSCCGEGDDDKGFCAGGCCRGQEDDHENDSDKSEYQLLLEEEDKPVPRKPARHEIYEGVPIQIV